MAIAVIAYAMATIIHETVGHAGVALLAGAKLKMITSIHMNYDERGISLATRKWIAAAGTIANFVTGCVALALLHLRGKRTNVAYFLWLFMSINFLVASGYPGYSGLTNIGDWAFIVRDLPHVWFWRSLLMIVTVVLYLFFMRVSSTELARLIGSRDRAVARQLTLPAYLTGGVLYCASGAFNPLGPKLILISAAAASFGATYGVVGILGDFHESNEQAAFPVTPSTPWVSAGAVAALLFIFVLGRGFTF